MRRHNILKIPLLDLLHTLVPAISIFCTNQVPRKPSLPNRVSLSAIQLCEQARKDTARRGFTSLGILLVSRHVEQHVCLNQGLGLLMQEDKLLVDMGIDVLDLEFLVEGLIYAPFLALLLQHVFLLLGEHFMEVENSDGFIGAILGGALLW